MSDPQDPFPSLSALLRDALGDMLAPGATSLLEMASDEIVMEFPYAPPGALARLEGRAALADYLVFVSGLVTIESMSVPVVHRSIDPQVAVLEFTCTGRGAATGARYDQTYISVLRIESGKIVHYRDYWNPLVVLGTAGAEALATPSAGADDGR